MTTHTLVHQNGWRAEAWNEVDERAAGGEEDLPVLKGRSVRRMRRLDREHPPAGGPRPPGSVRVARSSLVLAP